MLSKKFNPLRTSCQDADPPTSTTLYVFSSPPKPVWRRPVYRNNVPRPRGVHDYYNVMWDPRVRRGDAEKREEEKQHIKKCLTGKPAPKKKPREAKKSVQQRDVKRGETPPPADGRRNSDSQTELMVEGFEDEVAQLDVKTQTEALHDLPVVPWFVWSKIGQDQATEIEPGDLFDFNLEVKPLIETLIGKVVEQALLEVMEEEELFCLKDQQQEFEERRRLEQLRLDRLREREERVNAEREYLLQAQRQQLLEEEETEDAVAARAFASLYLARATCHAVDSLERDGYFNAKAMIMNAFLPWLNCEVEHLLAKENMARALLDVIIQNVVITREAKYAGSGFFIPQEDGLQPAATGSAYLRPEDE